jgi:hypothetical protein
MAFYKNGITERPVGDQFLNEMMLPVTVGRKSFCRPGQFLIDTGANKSMLSYRFGLEIGLEAPGRDDKKYCAYDVNEQEVPYIVRKVDLHISKDIKRLAFPICGCTRPRIQQNFLGMDFFHRFKLIVTGGCRKVFYVADSAECVDCRN